MKKGLSILLVAAALFGFYGSAVNLNDVLACKDYWEEAGEKTTADMNKLEDGLNQLKENEEAYLDGLQQVADGEEALAQGEKDLEAGKAELAKGEADYAAAPGKLADARKQIAQGEKDLAAGKDKLDAGYADYEKGKKDLADGKAQVAQGEKDLAAGKKTAAEGTNALNGAINYLNQVKTGYAVRSTQPDGSAGPSWKAGFKALEDGRKTAAGMLAQEEYKGLIEKLKALTKNPDLAKNIDTTSSYADFDKSVVELINTFKALAPTLQDGKALADAYKDNAELKGASALLKTTAPEGATDEEKAKLEAKKAEARKAVAAKIQSLDTTKLAPVEALDKESYDKLAGAISVLAANSDDVSHAVYAGTIDGLQAGLSNLSDTLAAYADKLSTTQGLLQQLDDGYKTLTGNQAYMAGALSQIYDGLLNNQTVADAFKNNAPALLAYMKGYNAKLVYGDLATEDLPKFVEDMDAITNTYNPNIIKVIEGVKKAIADEVKKGEDKLNAGKAAVADGEKKLAQGAKDLAKGEKDYAAGKKKLADGKAQYAQGLKDYEAAPAKLEDGRKALAEGMQKLEDGRADLAAGKEKLAEYEDGEQQVRDGLATLAGTKPDLSLESILDRLGGDDDFDNGDNHLDLDEGLAAVDVGRGYQADDGVLITNEIMARAVGTGALLGAGALAVLAAILSFLKKNKGAGVAAILAAAAGAFGAFYGTNAGTYFSDIAGSTAGNAAWIAAGILGAVALVHAIVHFTAKTDA